MGALAIAPNGTWFAAAGVDGSLQTWDVVSGTPIRTFAKWYEDEATRFHDEVAVYNNFVYECWRRDSSGLRRRGAVLSFEPPDAPSDDIASSLRGRVERCTF